jgi:hypothetical protein
MTMFIFSNRVSEPQQPIQIITGVARTGPSGQTAGQGLAPPVGLVPQRWSTPPVGLERPRASATIRVRAAGATVVATPRRAASGLAALLLGLIGLVTLAGCSSLRLGYDNLSTLARWEIDRYVDLDDPQEAVVDQRLREVHQWHREAQLPRYVRFVEEVRAAATGEITPALVAQWRNAAMTAWPPLVDRLAPGVAELARTLRPEQLDRFERELAAANRDFERKHFGGRTPAAVRAARIERWQQRAEQFLGPLNGPQLEVLTLRAQREGTAAGDSDWWLLRRARQQVWVGLLRGLASEKPPTAEATERARAALMALAWPVEPGSKARSEASARTSDEFVAAILQRMSPVQQRHLDEKLRDYAGELGRMVAGGPAAARLARAAAAVGSLDR